MRVSPGDVYKRQEELHGHGVDLGAFHGRAFQIGGHVRVCLLYTSQDGIDGKENDLNALRVALGMI